MILRGNIINPKVLVVGEAWGEWEAKKQLPFVGPSGQELDSQLLEAGFDLSEVCFGNVCDFRPQKNGYPTNDIEQYFPPKTKAPPNAEFINGRYVLPEVAAGRRELLQFLSRRAPSLILAMGNTPLWALAGLEGIRKWRGSELAFPGSVLIPTYHPAAVLREWSLRHIVLHDLRRALRDLRSGIAKPNWKFYTRPSFEFVMSFLRQIQTSQPIVQDMETRGGNIACVGIATSKDIALCIPFMCIERREGYWTKEEELAIILELRRVLTQNNIIMQNAAFDCQYFAKQYGFLPNVTDDTMLAHHVCFPGTRKALDYQASIYCEYYKFWKDDGKTWDENMNEDQLWSYNCEDCVRTFECWEAETIMLQHLNLQEQYKFQMRLLKPVLSMMLRGFRIDTVQKKRVSNELNNMMKSRLKYLEHALGESVVGKQGGISNKKLQSIFYSSFNVRPILHKKTKRPTLDDDALEKIAKKYLLLAPLIKIIQEYRSLGVYKNTFADAFLSEDNRMRCSINLAGTETFRFSTSGDAFGTGSNMQNLPKGGDTEKD